jgi:hypothetical protein
MNRVYKWRRQLKADAQAVGEWLHALPDRSAEAIVNAARSKKSPAHSIFEWDDTEAARQFRLVQARVMVQSLDVEVIDGDGEVVEVNAFIAASDRGKYVPVFEASEEELTSAEQRFLDQAMAFERRYANLGIAKPVIMAIRQVRKTNGRRRKAA